MTFACRVFLQRFDDPESMRKGADPGFFAGRGPTPDADP
jgi:hypothetical protein